MPGILPIIPMFCAEAVHHLLHEEELLHELLHLRLGLAGALGDALDARRLADERVGSLRSNFVSDWMIASMRTSSLVVEVRARRDHVAHARHLRDEVLERPHLLDHPDLLEEVVEGEVPLEHLHRLLGGLLLVDDLLEVLHQADDVAHAEDAARHAVGAELLELVDRLADADEADGRAGDLLHAERRAAARVAVELREDDAGEAEALVERLATS